jgi:hypothetical protein
MRIRTDQLPGRACLTAHMLADPALDLSDPADRAEQADRWLIQMAADTGLFGMAPLVSKMRGDAARLPVVGCSVLHCRAPPTRHRSARDAPGRAASASASQAFSARRAPRPAARASPGSGSKTTVGYTPYIPLYQLAARPEDRHPDPPGRRRARRLSEHRGDRVVRCSAMLAASR